MEAYEESYDVMRAERDAALGEGEMAVAAMHAAIKQRDSVAADVEAYQESCDALRAERDAAILERETAVAEKAAIVAHYSSYLARKDSSCH